MNPAGLKGQTLLQSLEGNQRRRLVAAGKLFTKWLLRQDENEDRQKLSKAQARSATGQLSPTIREKEGAPAA